MIVIGDFTLNTIEKEESIHLFKKFLKNFLYPAKKVCPAKGHTFFLHRYLFSKRLPALHRMPGMLLRFHPFVYSGSDAGTKQDLCRIKQD